MAQLEVQIGGDITDLNKKIKEAELNLKELSKIKLEQIKLGLDTKEINGNIASVKKSLTELKTVSKDTGSAISGMAPKVANGGNALMQFSRIAQDAPFGIMGIGNNITATVEAFGHLKQSTGSAGGALKAIASSMLGSGGILLAVSLVTSGLTYMAQNGLTVGDVMDKLSGNFNNLQKAMQDVNNEAAKNAGAEIATMNALVAVAKDENNTRQERLAAVQKLQKEYPAYFGNLTQEAILSGNVESAVKAVTFALIQKSKAQIIANRIAENDLKILELQQKGQKQLADFANGKGLFAILKGAIGMQTMKASVDSTASSIDDLKKEQALLTAELEKSTKAANTFEAANEKAGAKKKVVKAKATKVVKDTFDEQKSLDRLKEIAVQMQAVTSIPLFENNEKTQANVDRLKEILFEMSSTVDSETQKMLDFMKRFSDSANQLIASAITDTFSSLGTMIGNSLSGADGGLKDAGKNILGILGNFMTDFGKLMIETGIGLVIAKKMLTSGNGYAMIAGGIALVAIGTAFANSSKKARESGGNAIGGGSTGGGYSSPASSSSYSGSSSSMNVGGTVVFEISGQSLIGVLNNTLDKNRRLGGS